ADRTGAFQGDDRRLRLPDHPGGGPCLVGVVESREGGCGFHAPRLVPQPWLRSTADVERGQLMTATDISEVADRLFRAIEAGDIATVSELFSDDIAVWR